jgi:hypothetical protein
VDDAITRTVTAAIWFGITTGYLTLTGTYRIPRKFLHHYLDQVAEPLADAPAVRQGREAGNLAITDPPPMLTDKMFVCLGIALSLHRNRNRSCCGTARTPGTYGISA